MEKAPVFYGWRIVQASVVIAFVSWSFALYGPSVYLNALSQTHGWSMGEISLALTMSFLANAFSIGFVGSMVGRYGSRILMAVGAVLMATGLILIGQITAVWQAFIVFPIMGIGWSCLSTIAITSTIAPWFERHQGKALSTALLGASLGGMFGVPISLFFVTNLGLAWAMLVIGSLVLLIIVPLSLLVLRRRPQDIGLLPDGLAPVTSTSSTPIKTKTWGRKEALKTYALRSVIIAFGLGLMVQVGFLSQQVKLLQNYTSATGISLTVLASGTLAFLGRIILARHADRINIRHAAGLVLGSSAFGMLVMAFSNSGATVILGLLIFGFNVGNLTTLPALIVRREFGAASFGRVFGFSGSLMQFVTALGPAFFGILRDIAGNYTLSLLIAASLLLTSTLFVMHGQWRAPFRLERD
ncbi:MFS transporter [Orrella sp. 11846]|uniref:MFS transporter n=1 Tax=Orrella sp. 11846 TaxID=3409913 RepID=UPI003B5B7110